MTRSGSVLVAVVTVLLGACGEEQASYSGTRSEDSLRITVEVLDLRVDEPAAGVQRIEADVFLNGDVTQEQAVLAVRQALDSLWSAYPRATTVRTIGFTLNFAEAQGERVPLHPVLFGERLPIARDTLAVRHPSDDYRSHITVIGALPSSER